MLSFHELSLWNWKISGALTKQWNPLMRGGMSLAGDPQVPIFSPSMILARMIDPAAAIKISCLFFLCLGGAGAWLLARDLLLDRATAALAAALFAGNGYIVSRFSHGHIVFLGTLGLPLWLWASRRSLPAPGEPPGQARRRLWWLVIAGAVLFALSTDGAPITILLLLVWIGLDSAVLAWQRHSLRPLIFFAGSVAVGACLDAISFFPLAANAALFPRARAPVFIDPLVFFWFLLLPVRGKVLPAPANGHEFSVYIGPVIAYLLVRYRRDLAAAFPQEDRRRLLVVSAATFVIGLGAWRALAPWLPPGPFDLLHRLPGFLAIGIPSRFWGFLALPLALGSAVAIRRLEGETTAEQPRRLLWFGLLLFTIGFQAVALATPFVSARGRIVVRPAPIPEKITTIENIHGPAGSQAAQLRPATDLMEAYNAHDFIQGAIAAGPALVLQARQEDGSALPAAARWNGWSQIRLDLPSGASPGAVIVFNQNSHPRWTATRGAATRNRQGNLCLRLTGAEPPGARLTLDFRDPSSILGARVSELSALLIALAASLLFLSGAPPRKTKAPGQHAEP